MTDRAGSTQRYALCDAIKLKFSNALDPRCEEPHDGAFLCCEVTSALLKFELE